MPEVTMPRLSDSMEEGTILKWLKSDGDEIKRGDELCEIETDKANMTFEAHDEGVLTIVAKEGDTLPVGDLIARIGEPGADEGAGAEPAQEPAAAEAEQPAPAAAEAQAAQPAAAQATATQTGAAPGEYDAETEGGGRGPAPADTDVNGRVKASPVARRMAREIGLDLGRVQGTGPGGRIVKADIEAAANRGDAQVAEAAAPAQAEAPPAQAAPEAAPAREVPAPVTAGATDGGTAKGETTTQDLTRLQQVIARRMAESKATAPEFVLTVEVDMEDAVELRKQLKAAAAEGETVPSFNDFVIKASALALRDFPRANGAYRDGKFELYSRVNIGMAVAAQDALVVPTVFDADTKSIGQIARDARAVAERVRAGAITPPELSGGTFTVSNLGMFGIKRFVAVINPPQAAILAVGALEPRPVVRDGEVVVRNMMELTLACDHRILYGADAAQFLGRIRERLERPLSLAL